MTFFPGAPSAGSPFLPGCRGPLAQRCKSRREDSPLRVARRLRCHRLVSEEDPPVLAEATCELGAEPSEVFALIGDHASLPQWIPGLRRVDVDESRALSPRGVGTRRTLRMLLAPPGVEVITAFEPPVRLVYSATDESLRGLCTRHSAELSCAACGTGTRLRWTVRAQPSPSWWRRIVAHFMFSLVVPSRVAEPAQAVSAVIRTQARRAVVARCSVVEHAASRIMACAYRVERLDRSSGWACAELRRRAEVRQAHKLHVGAAYACARRSRTTWISLRNSALLLSFFQRFTKRQTS